MNLVMIGNLDHACRIGPVVYDADLFTFRNKRIHKDILNDGSGAGKEHSGIHLRISMNDINQLLTDFVHYGNEFFLPRADVGNHLGVFNRIAGRCRARIQ
jgi:hypothetical protein